MTSVGALARRVDRAALRLSTLSLQRMESSLPWFEAMSPEVRSAVGVLVQAGIRGFAEWLRAPAEGARITGDVFGAAPQEMARLVTLQQTVELVRVAVETTEEQIGQIATGREEEAWLREATLRYSREVAFAAALVYARAAEQRGAWDARLESLVVDSILRGDIDDAVLSRAAALGWSQPRAVGVVAGFTDAGADPEQVVEAVHARAAAVGADVLAGVQSQRLVVLVGSSGRVARVVRAVVPAFGPGPVVTGPVVETLAAAGDACRAAFAALRAAPAWPDAPRPVASSALLPERVLVGDESARRELVEAVYLPLAQRDDELLHTVSTWLSCGASIEATARALFVHPNTVRYRLARAEEACGRDLGEARGRFDVQTALALGRLDHTGVL
ncbi:MAG TPA: helix-turn-helix domain-containing protein [Mycobacteriales bacterium]|nr:helix-turn-helix domain-containing protein [Mycobacteriales bacterium]